MNRQLPVVKPVSPAWRFVRRIAIAIAGGVVVLVGVILLPLPGPGSVVIALGLGILSLEFHTPRRWLKLAKAKLAEVTHKVRAWRRK